MSQSLWWMKETELFFFPLYVNNSLNYNEYSAVYVLSLSMHQSSQYKILLHLESAAMELFTIFCHLWGLLISINSDDNNNRTNLLHPPSFKEAKGDWFRGPFLQITRRNSQILLSGMDSRAYYLATFMYSKNLLSKMCIVLIFAIRIHREWTC